MRIQKQDHGAVEIAIQRICGHSRAGSFGGLRAIQSQVELSVLRLVRESKKKAIDRWSQL